MKRMKREHIWAHHEQDATRFWKLAEGGYADRVSVRQGEEISLHISNSRSYYEILVFREGAKRELVMTIPDLRGQLQDVRPTGYRDGFGWQPTVRFRIPDDWKSGIYLATFPTPQGPREILFIVRPKAPCSPILLTIAYHTYNAYNNVGGKCFYDYISTGRQHSKLISVHRPLQPDIMGNFYIWDQFFTSWLDAEGYDVDYCVNADHDAEPEILQPYHCNLRIGHDEYNTREELAQVRQLVRRGGNLLLFTGNAFCREVESRNDGSQLYCEYGQLKRPPTPEQPETSYYQFLDQLRQKTIGLSYTSFVHTKKNKQNVFLAPTTDEFGFYRVVEPDHWVFAGTGLSVDDEFGREDSIVGVEADAADLEWVDGKPVYTGRDGVSKHYRILAIADAASNGPSSHFVGNEGRPLREPKGDATAYGTVAMNETEFPGTIFNAATIEWGHGLYHDDSTVVTITRNVLNRLGTQNR
jgi:hypothetical protein